MELHCGNFLLRPPGMSDKDSLVKYANNHKIWRNMRDRFPHPYTPDDAVAFLTGKEDQNPVTDFCIEFDGECIGMIGIILQTDVYRRSAEFGYWLGEPFWGRGIATTAARKLTQYVFEQTDIVRLYAGVFEWNKGSMRVLEKAGFRLDCIFEKSVYKDNIYTDGYHYSLLSPSIL